MRAAKVSGFTIIELIVVMAVLGILAMGAMPLVELSLQRDRERELKRSLWEIRDAIDAYKRASDTGLIARVGTGYPPSLQALTQGVPEAKGGGQLHYFLRRVPPDPFATVATTTTQQWGLRSYASPPERPQVGNDVYDVYSRSDRVGLNGVPLKHW